MKEKQVREYLQQLVRYEFRRNHQPNLNKTISQREYTMFRPKLQASPQNNNKCSTRYDEPDHVQGKILFDLAYPNIVPQRPQFKIRNKTSSYALRANRLKSLRQPALLTETRVETAENQHKISIGIADILSPLNENLIKPTTNGMPTRVYFRNRAAYRRDRKSLPQSLRQNESSHTRPSIFKHIHTYHHYLPSVSDLHRFSVSDQPADIYQDTDEVKVLEEKPVIQYMTEYGDQFAENKDMNRPTQPERLQKKSKNISINVVRDKIKRTMLKSQYKERLSQNFLNHP